MAYVLYKMLWKKESKPREHCQHDQVLQQDLGQPTEGRGQPAELSDLASSEKNDPQPQVAQKKFEFSNFDPNTRCSICEDEKQTGKKYRWKLMVGLSLPFLVQALDITIIAGALPFITSDFNELSQLNWIVSAFNLAATTFIPAWGQFADIFGRYTALQAALVSMVIGSTLCASAPVTAFTMLLFGRALQGIGCSGLLIVTKVVLADKVSLAENARNNTTFTIIAGVGYGIGPIVGGYLTQYNWRFCFILNIPIGVFGAILVHFVLRPVLLGPQKITRSDGTVETVEPPSTFTGRISTVDLGGQVLFIFGVGLLVLALTWAGSYYPWSDIKVILPLVLGSLLSMLFLAWEFFMVPGSRLATKYPYRKAMIPMRLLFTRNAGLLMYINFVTGMAMYAVFYFVDLYFVLVSGDQPGDAGKNLLYYTPGLGVGACLAIFACNVYPRQTWFPLAVGTVIEPLGITLLAVALKEGHLPLIYGMLALTGVGTGVRFMPGTLHGVGYFPESIAPVISLMSFAISLGGTFATTFMLNIFNNSMGKAGLSFNSNSASSLDAISSLSPTDQAYLRENSKGSIALSFFAVSAFMWLAVLAASELGNVDIAKNGKESESDGGHERGGKIVKGSYVRSVLFRRRKTGLAMDKS